MELRLINALVQKIVEEESLHSHKEVFRSRSSGNFYKYCQNVLTNNNPDFYSVIVLQPNSLHITSMVDWMMANGK